jgi:hypothetical protein
MIDGAQFEGAQEQAFEDVPEQRQYFDEVMRASLIWMHTTLLYWIFKVQSLELVHDN